MLGWVLVAVGLAIALAAGLLLFRFSGWFLPWLKGTLGLTVVLLGVLVMAAGWSALQWQGVSPDRPLYRLSIASEGDNGWRIGLRDEGELLHERSVRGDLLELRGRLLILDVPLGGRAPSLLYRTDSIRGFDPDSRTPIQFNTGSSEMASEWFDLWRWDRAVPLPGVRAESLYPLWVPMIDGAVFEVVLQGNQIVSIPANSAAEQALERKE